jgi:3-oxoacyl-[acyl-carrier-protein] synthase II
MASFSLLVNLELNRYLYSTAPALIGGVMTLREGLIPPTINTTNFDPAIEPIALVTQPTTFAPREKFVLTNAFGFGGYNAFVLIKKF